MKNITRIPSYEIMPFKFLGDEARVELMNLCNQDYIIPQEIMNHDVLTNWNTISDYEHDLMID